ncbi:uncharacterized protein LOC127136121 [Lathyrus oleraceus]|uniref:uncharacterized protein LOC127136121 n=1 Tax=Pisum sativum TaxID=3888 RepID=UPI0021CF5015|nr:uncharacterized protein LOC127136121 [Pisum sativum]
MVGTCQGTNTSGKDKKNVKKVKKSSNEDKVVVNMHGVKMKGVMIGGMIEVNDFYNITQTLETMNACDNPLSENNIDKTLNNESSEKELNTCQDDGNKDDNNNVDDIPHSKENESNGYEEFNNEDYGSEASEEEGDKITEEVENVNQMEEREEIKEDMSQYDVNDNIISNIDDEVLIINVNETTTKSAKRSKEKAWKRISTLKPMKNTTKNYATPIKRRKISKKNEDFLNNKKSTWKKSVTKKPTSKEKFMMKRKKVPEVEVIEEDLNINLDDILVHVNKKSKKVVGSKKLPNNIHVVPMDNITFHSKERVLKWKYIYHRRIAHER